MCNVRRVKCLWQDAGAPPMYVNLAVDSIRMAPRIMGTFETIAEQLQRFASSPCCLNDGGDSVMRVALPPPHS